MAQKQPEENYYKILKCEETSTYEELKTNYQKLIKEFHPDKQADNTSHERFLQIDKAWKVLRDETQRNAYNASLLQNKMSEDSLIYAELNKNELIFQDRELLYPCRCGSSFTILKEYLSEDESIIECSDCSNCLLIK